MRAPWVTRNHLVQKLEVTQAKVTDASWLRVWSEIQTTVEETWCSWGSDIHTYLVLQLMKIPIEKFIRSNRRDEPGKLIPSDCSTPYSCPVGWNQSVVYPASWSNSTIVTWTTATCRISYRLHSTSATLPYQSLNNMYGMESCYARVSLRLQEPIPLYLDLYSFVGYEISRMDPIQPGCTPVPNISPIWSGTLWNCEMVRDISQNN